MKLDELRAWLSARPGVLMNFGKTEPSSVFLIWLSWEEDGQQLEMPWRVESDRDGALEEALTGLTGFFERRVKGHAAIAEWVSG